jgi:hypothetical protein
MTGRGDRRRAARIAASDHEYAGFEHVVRFGDGRAAPGGVRGVVRGKLPT